MRRTLADVLAYLSRQAIKKHDMKLVVVAGRHGTKITGELLAEMMSPEYVVRRQLEKPFWDFSIPLAILGVDDKRYSFFGWCNVVVESGLQLLFGPVNPTWTILQMNTFKKDIAEYWAKIIEPEVVVLVNTENGLRRLEKLLIQQATQLVVMSECRPKGVKVRQGVMVRSIGRDMSCDYQLVQEAELKKGTKFRVRYKGDGGLDAKPASGQVGGPGEGVELELLAFQKGEFMKEPILMSVATLLGLGFERGEIVDKLLRAQVDVERFVVTAGDHNLRN